MERWHNVQKKKKDKRKKFQQYYALENTAAAIFHVVSETSKVKCSEAPQSFQKSVLKS